MPIVVLTASAVSGSIRASPARQTRAPRRPQAQRQLKVPGEFTPQWYADSGGAPACGGGRVSALLLRNAIHQRAIY